MKDKEICRFERSFSSLGHLQNGGRMVYALRQEGPQSWRVSVTFRQGGKEREEECAIGPITRQTAVQLLQCLYENAVPQENWRDVLQELMHKV